MRMELENKEESLQEGEKVKQEEHNDLWQIHIGTLWAEEQGYTFTR